MLKILEILCPTSLHHENISYHAQKNKNLELILLALCGTNYILRTQKT